MIGRVCRFYGWTDAHVLAMPASRFFLMHENSVKLEGQESARKCHIARAATLETDAFNSTVDIFNSLGQKRIKPPDVDLEAIQNPKLTLEEQKNAMCNMFSQDRRVHRKITVTH